MFSYIQEVHVHNIICMCPACNIEKLGMGLGTRLETTVVVLSSHYVSGLKVLLRKKNTQLLKIVYYQTQTHPSSVITGSGTAAPHTCRSS